MKQDMVSNRWRELFSDVSGPILITSEQNIFYVTGFATEARRPTQIGLTCAILTDEALLLLCPENWVDIVKTQVETTTVCVVGYKGAAPELAAAIEKYLGSARILGFEKDGMELSLYLALMERYKEAKWQDVSPALKRARLVKKPEEIMALRQAAKLASAAMEHAKTLLKPGKEEYQVVAELEYFMRKNGSQGVPFTMKVLAGDNAIKTINLPGKNQIVEGDIVLLDFGAIVQNYASDWTRSFAIGKASAQQQELYDLVWKIERSCIEMIRPGVKLASLMDKAMEIAQESRFAQYFNPYLGHSIGISSQEWPFIVPGVEGTLEENMVITIEPGVYVPGVGGVRIEDEILVTNTGHEILTGLQKEEFVLEI
ncbi:MAG: Xaa-Pro dipeptidase [Thermoanaerobacteraceae bacterium]|nr:Xaa-Pro dipeptidase [Thermoanaerobacteraceae bacterium]